MRKKSILIISAIFTLYLFLGLNQIQAQASRVIITWEADNFYPSNYQGKAYPTRHSQVILSAQLLRDSKITDLSGANILWYSDGNLIGEGVGLDTVSFWPTRLVGDNHRIRVSVRKDGRTTESTKLLPVLRPQIAINLPVPNRLMPHQHQTRMIAIPYFWNITSVSGLEFFWETGETKHSGTGENNILLSVRRPTLSSERINIKATARNILRPTETASETSYLTVY